jgi:hypothetical protein
MRAALSASAIFRSYACCRFSHDVASPPRNFARRNAVSGVMPRRPRTMSFTRVAGTCSLLASALTLKSRGARQSSRRMSPGWIGRIPFLGVSHSIAFSVVVDDLDMRRPVVGPDEANAPTSRLSCANQLLLVVPPRLHEIAAAIRPLIRVDRRGLHSAYTNAENKKPSQVGWAKCLILLVGRAGFEPATNGLKVRCSTS